MQQWGLGLPHRVLCLPVGMRQVELINQYSHLPLSTATFTVGRRVKDDLGLNFMQEQTQVLGKRIF